MTMTIGDERRNEGMEQVLENEGQSEYREAAERIMTELINTGEVFSANDFHERLQDLAGHHPNTLGAVFGAASRQNRIKRVGTTKTLKATSNSHQTTTWIAVGSAPRTNEQRYLEALQEIMVIIKQAEEDAAQPGQLGRAWHAGRLGLTRQLTEVFDKKRA